jgi:hypothetical protein
VLRQIFSRRYFLPDPPTTRFFDALDDEDFPAGLRCRSRPIGTSRRGDNLTLRAETRSFPSDFSVTDRFPGLQPGRIDKLGLAEHESRYAAANAPRDLQENSESLPDVRCVSPTFPATAVRWRSSENVVPGIRVDYGIRGA